MQTARDSFEATVEPGHVDVNLEFAHVYTDESFGPEHQAGAEETRRIKRQLSLAGRSVSLALLVDDYNPTKPILDLPAFIDALAASGARPDHVAYESCLVRPATLLLARLRVRERQSLNRYIEAKGKVPCSLLVAAWHLLRLGVTELDVTREVPGPATGFVGRRAVTVLPERFAPVEERAREIINSSPYADLASRMEYTFFTSPCEPNGDFHSIGDHRVASTG